jgi:hypothetical protein
MRIRTHDLIDGNDRGSDADNMNKDDAEAECEHEEGCEAIGDDSAETGVSGGEEEERDHADDDFCGEPEDEDAEAREEEDGSDEEDSHVF